MKIRYVLNDKLRIKVTDKCNMHCSFCHFEGAKGAKDLAINDETIQILKIAEKKFFSSTYYWRRTLFIF